MTTMNNEDSVDPTVVAEPVAWAVMVRGRVQKLVVREDVADEVACKLREQDPRADAVPLYTADQMREAVAAERERSDELAAMRLLVRELRGRLERVKSEPQDTMSDSKAVSAMVRHAKLGLQAIERLDRAAEKEQPK